MSMTRFAGPVVAGALMLCGAHGALALDGKTIFAARCASCHNISGPAPKTFEGVLKRKAPDLFYAGSKFKRAWLVLWLRKPTIIRRSGVMFLHNIVNVAGKDRVRKDRIKPCASRLTRNEAVAVADYLMTLKDRSMKTGVVDATKKIRKSKALLLFSKRLPCIGCHTIKFGKRVMGGISGPDLRGAGQRLNPDWVYARIGNPQYWDPKTWMPRIRMSHRKRELLSLFINSMK